MLLDHLTMDALRVFYVRHAHAVRWAWIVLLLILAACNSGDNSGGGGGGGGGGGDGGPGY
jgi:hypothetical protein